MTRYRQLSYIAGIAALLCYVSFALLAFLQYPTVYSPLSNWLSDLGNRDANPNGAFFYNAGIIAAGLLLVAFFLGLARWKMAHARMQKTMLLLTQGFGVLGSLALIMSAVFPINNLGLHQFWSISLYILLGTAFVFSVFALRYHPRCPRWLLVLGLITGLADILSGILQTVHVLEWITVALFLSYVLVVGIETRAAQ